MNSVDIILGILLILAFISGYKKGLLLALSGLIGLIAGIFGAYYFWQITGRIFFSWFDWNPKTIMWISFLITFLIITIAVNILGRILTKIINFVFLGFINKILGGLFSVISFAFFISVIFLFLENSEWTGYAVSEEKKETSKLYEPIASLAPAIVPGLLQTYEEWKEELMPEEEEAPSPS